MRLRALAGALALGAAAGPAACGAGKGSAADESGQPGIGAAGAADTQPSSPLAVDSVVLERTTCFGPCPAYRLSVAASGRVHFTSRNPGDASRTAQDMASRGAAAELLARAEQVGFFQLPERPADDSTLCPQRATDHPTVTVWVFGRERAGRVEDYTGCYVSVDPPRVAERLLRLRAFEDAIDSVAGSSRWARPARRD
jgi:hypothetical protein